MLTFKDTGYRNGKTMDSCKHCHIRSEAFNVLTQTEMVHFEQGCTQVHFDSGDKILSEGIPVTHVVYLKEGMLKLVLKSASGKNLILKILIPGSFVGLHDVFAGHIRYCTAIALSPVTACFISHDVFGMLVRSNGDFAFEVLKYISQEEINYLHRFINMHEKQVNGRVAEIILHLANEVFHSEQFSIPLTQKELGIMVGTSRESISRVIKAFRNDGILTWHQQTLNIHKKELLEKISRAG